MHQGVYREGKKALFIDALSNLSIDILILLKAINDNSAKDRNASLAISYIRERAKYDGVEYLMANLRNLERYNLVEIKRPDVTMDFYANYSVFYGKLGKEFISFIMDYC